MLKEMFMEAVKQDEEDNQLTDRKDNKEDEASKRRERFMNILNEKLADNE
jgi:hypothetical protein